MARLRPLASFGIAVLFALAWFAGIMITLNGREPSPLFHILILLVPLVACGSIQFLLSRNMHERPLRRLIQTGCAAVLAPVLATALVCMLWIVVLGHGK